ncbi:MAG TPA: polyamine aminopropyltransferase [Bacillales bacterium]|nr:polyamine aminopropyltransferase [Bacillales bacterium]
MMKETDLKKTKRIYWASGIVSICGIIFEVLFGALGSYILGDGVKQYTLTISLFLTGMGIGAFLSERVIKQLIATFIRVEFAVALIGGFSALFMFGVSAYLPPGTNSLYLYTVILIVGMLTGLELPILIRKAHEIGVAVHKSTARVLFADYAGGLVGGILFILWLRPEFGLVKTAFIVAIANAGVALWTVYGFRDEIKHTRGYSVVGWLIMICLVAGALFGGKMAFTFEQKLYKDPIIFSKQTQYQHIIMTKEQGDYRLYLDGNLQFSSVDEARYHEVLVHPTMALAKHPHKVLILGGGDGLAAREVLKYKEVRHITLVDIDPEMTHLARNYPLLVKLNKGSMLSKRVTVHNKDAFQYLKRHQGLYDVVIVDLPDPNNISLNKVYTKEFYELIRNHLAPGGAMVVQATSPVFATKVYWTINKTVESAGLYTGNLHVNVPSFGDWGFVLAARHPFKIKGWSIPVKTRFLKSGMIPALTHFGKDADSKIYVNGKRIKFKPNTLVHPDLIRMYQKAWRYYH